MKLEIKHLAPYLPYGLEMIREDKIHVLTVATFSYRLHDSKPILRPLSDLTREVHVGELSLIPAHILQLYHWEGGHTLDRFTSEGAWELASMHKTMQQLFEWHFDIFSLIPAGLAIDVNTIMK